MEYDVLMSYAVTGLLVAYIVRGGSRRIKKGMIFSGVIHLLVMSCLMLYSLSEMESASDDQSGEPALEEQLPETWISQVQERLQYFFMYREEAIFIIPMNTFLFLLGVRMMRAGVFYANERGQSLRKILFRIGLWIVLAAECTSFRTERFSGICGALRLFTIPLYFLYSCHCEAPRTHGVMVHVDLV